MPIRSTVKPSPFKLTVVPDESAVERIEPDATVPVREIVEDDVAKSMMRAPANGAAIVKVIEDEETELSPPDTVPPCVVAVTEL